VVEDSISETEELPDLDNRKNIGEYVVAVYEEQWFLAEIAKTSLVLARATLV